jgi:hypothetical protein
MRLAVPIFAVVFLASSFARADAIYLQGGHKLEGTATVEGDKVTVELESGRVSFARSEVERIEKSTAPLDEARSREAKLKSDDVAGMLLLADYCRDHDLPSRERALLERIIAREPDHLEARHRLGYVRDGKAWVLHSEQVRKEQQARGNDLERRRQRMELEEAELRRDRAEAQLKQAQAELRASQQSAPPYAAYPATYARMPITTGYWSSGFNHRPAHPNANYVINGVRTPAEVIDDATRAAYGHIPGHVAR